MSNIREVARLGRGFTLLELLVSMLLMSMLALICYRGLTSVLEARDQVRAETEKWRRVSTFFERLASDINLAAPRSARHRDDQALAWRADGGDEPRLEFSRFVAATGVDTARRLEYRFSNQQVELWIWPGLDVAPSGQPSRHTLVSGIARFELRFLDQALAWRDVWPVAGAAPLPRALRVRLVLDSGEEVVRVFAIS